MILQRNQQALLKYLSPGDIFYFAGDKKKHCYTLCSDNPFFKKAQSMYSVEYANCIDKMPPVGELSIKSFKSYRRVIFLRNLSDP